MENCLVLWFLVIHGTLTAPKMDNLQNVANLTIGPVVDALEKLSWLGSSSHFIKLPFVDEKLVPVAASLGMGLPVIKVN